MRCDHRASRPVFGQRRITCCASCGHGQIDRIPTDEQLRSYYRDLYRQHGHHAETDLETFPFDNLWYLSRGRAIRQYLRRHASDDELSHASLLEVGAGFGYNLWALRERFDQMALIACEPDPVCAPFLERASCERFGLHLDDERAVSELGRRGPFDFLLISHVLEHVPDPADFLHRMLELLRPGGRLVLEIPHCPPHIEIWGEAPHISFFSLSSFETMCRAARLDLLDASSCGPSYEFMERRKPKERVRRAVRRILPTGVYRLARRAARRLTGRSARAEDPRIDVDRIPVQAMEQYGGGNCMFLRAVLRNRLAA